MRVMPSDMENFVYYNPVKVVFGSGSLKEVGTNVAAYGKKHCWFPTQILRF